MRSTLFAVVALVVGLVAPGVASAGPAPTTVTVTVAYGQLPDQTVDVTFDPQHARGRAVVGFHGGSGTGGSKANLAKAAATLARSGFVVFNVEYRKTTSDLGPLGSHWDAQRADAVAALDWARAHATTFGADPARFATYGFSWGGLLAATVGLEGQGTRKVQAVAQGGYALSAVLNNRGALALSGSSPCFPFSNADPGAGAPSAIPHPG